MTSKPRTAAELDSELKSWASATFTAATDMPPSRVTGYCSISDREHECKMTFGRFERQRDESASAGSTGLPGWMLSVGERADSDSNASGWKWTDFGRVVGVEDDRGKDKSSPCVGDDLSLVDVLRKLCQISCPQKPGAMSFEDWAIVKEYRHMILVDEQTGTRHERIVDRKGRTRGASSSSHN